LRRRVAYTDEFVARFRELTAGQQRLVEEGITRLRLAADPSALAHHLRRKPYFCSWSHRLRRNLLIVFRVSKRAVVFVSTGTHAQAYRPRP
jgi:hypothetical protein